MTYPASSAALPLLALLAAVSSQAQTPRANASPSADAQRTDQSVATAESASAQMLADLDAAARIQNVVAGRSHRVDVLRQEYGLTGNGVLVGVFETGDSGGNKIVTAHEAFGGRVSQQDQVQPTGFNAHATHVTGTIAADPPSGGTPDRRLATGMAPSVRVHGYHIGVAEETELSGVAAAMVASNHSYGPAIGWERVNASFCSGATGAPTPAPTSPNCWRWYGQASAQEANFGKYNSRSVLYDRAAADNPRRAIFVSAGNDRDDRPEMGFDGWHVIGTSTPLAWSHTARNADGFDNGGFDTISSGQASSKNVITIGSIQDIPEGDVRNPATIRVSDFSAWGPTDDGRIKPDLVANGFRLFSPSYSAGNSGQPDPAFYENITGTSMASPVATGIAALLNELATSRRGRSLFADELKAVLIHTAISPATGPSYRTGWGAIHALDAGRIVADDVRGSELIRDQLAGGPVELALFAQPRRAIKVTLVWTDPPGTANTGGVDQPASSLVNDLDLALIAPDGTAHAPWMLDPANPGAAATRCTSPAGGNPCPTNRRDTVEQVEIDQAAVSQGRWTVRVTPKAAGSTQAFALVFSGLGRSDPGVQTLGCDQAPEDWC